MLEGSTFNVVSGKLQFSCVERDPWSRGDWCQRKMRVLMKCDAKKAEGEEVVVVLTVGPLGPGNPMLPGSPLAPAGPMGPGRPSIPGRPWNQSLFNVYSASTGSHNLKLAILPWDETEPFSECIELLENVSKLCMHFPFLNRMSVHTHASQSHRYTIPPFSSLFQTLSLSSIFPALFFFFLLLLCSFGLCNYNLLLCIPRYMCGWYLFSV